MDFTDLGPAMSAAEGRDAKTKVEKLELEVAALRIELDSLKKLVFRIQEKVQVL